MSALKKHHDPILTDKPYLAGFAIRFHALCDILEMKKFGRTKFLTRISQLSWSGAKACLDEDRPPKRELAINSASLEISKLLKQQRRINVTPKDVEDYLVVGSGPLESQIQINDDKEMGARLAWDISQIPYSFNAQVMLMIHKVGNEMDIDVFTELEEQQLELLNRKMTIHCYYSDIDNNMESDESLKELIRSMIIVARAKLQ